MATSISSFWRETYRRWLARRIPRARTVVLDQRRIFIFPSATGFFFALCLLVMLVAAINYQNNMSYALTFLLANVFVIAVLHSYANLSGLNLTAVAAEDAFAGQRTAFRLRVKGGGNRGHYSIRLGWALPHEERRRRRFLVGLFSSPEMRESIEVDVASETSQECRFHLQVGERGWYRPGRLRVESVYPLGLLRCWTWVDLDFCALVYPRPKMAPRQIVAAEGGDEGLQIDGSGDDEFAGIRDYRPGDSPRRIYWRSIARGQEVLTKEFAAVVSDTRWLDWDAYQGLGNEARLSALCQEVLNYHDRALTYGLRLPGKELAPASGDRQRKLALQTLATFGLAPGDEEGLAPGDDEGFVRGDKG